MKLLFSLFGYASTATLSVGYTLNLLGYPIGPKLFMIGVLTLLIVYVPIYTMRKLKTTEKHAIIPRLKHGSGGVAGVLFGASAIFKWMHWPGADIILLLSMLVAVALFLPVLFIEMYKRLN